MTTRTPDEMTPGKQADEARGPKPVRYVEHDGRDDAAHRTGEEREGQEGEPEESADRDTAEQGSQEGGSKAA